MGRPITLFTGQWADLPLEDVARKASEFGYQGLELACWGDHFEVDKALSDDGYCADRRDLLERYDLQVHAISAHLVGQAVFDPIDERHQAILPPHVWGDGDPDGVNARAAEELQEHGARRAETGRGHRQRLHRLQHLASALFVSAHAGGDDRRRLRAVRRAVQSDPRRVRRMRRAVRAGSASDRDRLRPVHGRAGAGGHRPARGVRLQLRSQPLATGKASTRSSFCARFPIASITCTSRTRWCSSTAAAASWAATCRLAIRAAAGTFARRAAAASNFEEIIRALNQIKYEGPLSVEWEDPGMDREAGAQGGLPVRAESRFHAQPCRLRRGIFRGVTCGATRLRPAVVD